MNLIVRWRKKKGMDDNGSEPFKKRFGFLAWKKCLNIVWSTVSFVKSPQSTKEPLKMWQLSQFSWTELSNDYAELPRKDCFLFLLVDYQRFKVLESIKSVSSCTEILYHTKRVWNTQGSTVWADNDSPSRREFNKFIDYKISHTLIRVY